MFLDIPAYKYFRGKDLLLVGVTLLNNMNLYYMCQRYILCADSVLFK